MRWFGCISICLCGRNLQQSKCLKCIKLPDTGSWLHKLFWIGGTFIYKDTLFPSTLKVGENKVPLFF